MAYIYNRMGFVNNSPPANVKDAFELNNIFPCLCLMHFEYFSFIMHWKHEEELWLGRWMSSS